MTQIDDPEHAGDPTHPDHAPYLQALGEATLAAASLASHMIDILRVHFGLDFYALTRDVLGTLKRKLAQRGEALPGLKDAIPQLAEAIVLRNALAHALQVKHGLIYYGEDKQVVTFFDVEEVQQCTRTLYAAALTANAILYSDGGDAVHGRRSAE